MSALSGAGSPGEPDQDLVPEQEGQVEEGQRGQGRPGEDPGGAGLVQPPDRCRR